MTVDVQTFKQGCPVCLEEYADKKICLLHKNKKKINCLQAYLLGKKIQQSSLHLICFPCADKLYETNKAPLCPICRDNLGLGLKVYEKINKGSQSTVKVTSCWFSRAEDKAWLSPLDREASRANFYNPYGIW